MNLSSEDQTALKALEVRLLTILPAEYHTCYEDMQPVSMGSAGLRYRRDGKVAWDEIWASFCNLAMAGGPPHKGKLLEPASQEAIEAQTDRYRQVVEEICRGINMVTDLPAEPAPTTGWVRVTCDDAAMSGWLMRAILTENVSARCEGNTIDLPAGPEYRLEKEIKNVVTVISKTCHYWNGHVPTGQKQAIAELFEEMAVEFPLIQPEEFGPEFRADTHQILRGKMTAKISQLTGLRSPGHQYSGWLGLECADVPTAVWMMRALVATNVLSRREEATLFVPINPKSDPDGEAVIRSLVQIHRFYSARQIP